MKNTILLASWLLSSIVGFAQARTAYRFSLVVVNPQRQPIAGVTVKMLKTGKVLNAAAADEGGQVQFTYPGKGKYKFLISATGYQPVTTGDYLLPGSFGDTIMMHPLHKELTEVTVTAQMPLFERRRDRTIVNVEASPANAGSTIAEVLERSPGVTMDRSGGIALNGRQPVLIMIDDKPTYLSGDDLYNLLSSMNASQVSKIELISNPPAKYDAAGSAGIINIRTKKNSNDGFNGVLTTSYGQGVYSKSNSSLVLNYRKGLLNCFLNYSINDIGYLTDLYAYRQYYDGANVTGVLEQPTYFSGNFVNNTVKTGLDYSLTPSTTLGLVLTGTGINRSGSSTSHANWLRPDGTMDSSILTKSGSSNSFRNGAINLNAKQHLAHATELSADLDYLYYRMEGDQHFDNQLLASGGYDEIFRSNIPTTIDILTGQLNSTTKIGHDASIQAGLKYSSSHTDNAAEYQNLENGQWVDDDTRSNRFAYRENIEAAYASVEGSTHRWSYEGGARYEYTSYTTHESGNNQQHDSIASRKYGSLFPSGSLSYKADSLNSVTLTIGRRTDRPMYQNLNPFLYVINKYTYETGNPYLLPQYTWNIELDYQRGNLLTTGVSYSLMNNYFSQLFLSDTSKTILYYTQGNVGQVHDLGLSASLNLSPEKWWSAQLSVIFNHKQLKGFNGNVYTSTISQLHVNVNNQLSFGKGFTAEFSGFYTTRARNDIQELLYPTGQMSAGISKSMIKKKGTLKLGWRDIFYTNAMEGLTSFPGATEYFKEKRDSRVVTLSFSYRFGKSFKTTQHSGGAGEEKERVGNE